MLYLAETLSHSRMLAKRAERGALVRLARGIYSDDRATPAAEQIRASALAIAAHLFKNAYVSHRSAAERGPVGDTLFLSEPGGRKNVIVLPGLRVIRTQALSHPEIERVELPMQIVHTKDDQPAAATVRVSSALQTVFECLITPRRHPERQLSERALMELIATLSQKDIQRASAFAQRNQLDREYARLEALLAEQRRVVAVHKDGLRKFDLYFYNWHVGSLTALSNAEFRFEYNRAWSVPLSRELPLSSHDGVSFEGPRMPAFFENFLPEGWTENRIVKTYQLDPKDTVALLASTRKYLSNLTLRPLNIPEDEFRLDTHRTLLADVASDSCTPVVAQEHIEDDPETGRFWKELKSRGAVGLSGVQPKLPVSLAMESGGPTVRIGDLRTSCTHILKFQSPHYPSLVENEWATMELARRAGLRVAPVRIITFAPSRMFSGNSLIVERYDIPMRASLEMEPSRIDLALQEDACSLLLLHRNDKYKTSVERVANSLLDAGLPVGPEAPGMWRLIEHVAFSWLVGNGDLHAKNISIVRLIRSGALGAAPSLRAVEYAPLYDLLNTTVAIPDDDFALPVNGRRNKIRPRDIVSVAEQWKGQKRVAEAIVQQVATNVRLHLHDVLSCSHMPEQLSERYFRLVDSRLRGFGA
jgi:serine/threonine-protein kinase HipA